MENRRGNMAGGLILILLGLFFMVWYVKPDWVTAIFGNQVSWPFYIIGVGLVFLIVSLVTQSGGLSVPGCLVGGIGAILFYQNATGDWSSWGYLWPMVPGFVGLGLAVGGSLDKSMREERSKGTKMFLIALAVTAVLGGFFSANISLRLGGAILLILFGVYVLISSFFNKDS